MPRPLTESERNTLSNALIVAAQRFEDFQFKRQAEEARTLDALLQNADSITLGDPVPDEPAPIWDGKSAGGGTFERGE